MVAIARTATFFARFLAVFVGCEAKNNLNRIAKKKGKKERKKNETLMESTLMIYPRFLARFYAWMLGYFWLPCPKCGRMFGGQEVTMEIGNEQTQLGEVFCPSCAHRDFVENPIISRFPPEMFK